MKDLAAANMTSLVNNPNIDECIKVDKFITEAIAGVQNLDSYLHYRRGMLMII